MTRDAADGNHGGLDRAQEGKNGLEGGETIRNINALLSANQDFTFLLL